MTKYTTITFEIEAELLAWLEQESKRSGRTKDEIVEQATAAGRLFFGIFAALAEFESELIRERTMAGLQAARARGRKFGLSKAQVRMAQAAMANRDTSVVELCKELGVNPVTLYRYVDPNGNLRGYGKRVLSA